MLSVKTAMAAGTSKDNLKLTAEHALSVTERAAACNAAREAQPMSPEKSVDVEAQIAAGQAFMARYRQTFEALAK